jgi:hypothetical protein
MPMAHIRNSLDPEPDPDDGDWDDEGQTMKRCVLATFGTHGTKAIRELKPGDPFLEQIKGLNFYDPAEILRQNAPRGHGPNAASDFCGDGRPSTAKRNDRRS